jgi:hypothetical protein
MLQLIYIIKILLCSMGENRNFLDMQQHNGVFFFFLPRFSQLWLVYSELTDRIRD